MSKKLTREQAKNWRDNWLKSCQSEMKLSEQTPRGFLIDVETINQIIAKRPKTKELWISFGQENPQGDIKIILQPYIDPLEGGHNKSEEEEEDDIYDDFGTCCPK